MGLEEQILEMVGEKREEQVKERIARKFIFNSEFTDQQIAEMIEVPLNFVKKLRKQKISIT